MTWRLLHLKEIQRHSILGQSTAGRLAIENREPASADLAEQTSSQKMKTNRFTTNLFSEVPCRALDGPFQGLGWSSQALDGLLRPGMGLLMPEMGPFALNRHFETGKVFIFIQY